MHKNNAESFYNRRFKPASGLADFGGLDIALPPEYRFDPKCPHTQQLCRETEPQLVDTENNHYAACHRYQEITNHSSNHFAYY